MSTIASVLVLMGAVHRAQVDIGLRDPSLEKIARLLEKVSVALFGKSKSVMANVRRALQDQIPSQQLDRALLAQQ